MTGSHALFAEKVHPSPDALVLLVCRPPANVTNLMTLIVRWLFFYSFKIRSAVLWAI